MCKAHDSLVFVIVIVGAISQIDVRKAFVLSFGAVAQ